MMRVVDERAIHFEQGSFDVTGRPFDVAVIGDGFFEIQRPFDENVYTRNGSFTLDEEGYLYLQHIGRVIGTNGEPIFLGTDKIEVRTDGSIYHVEGGFMGRLRIADFVDYTLLEKTGEGMFLDLGVGNVFEPGFPTVRGQTLERSNVSAMEEMVAMITSQRSLQAASQIVKTYDQLMQKAANEIGRV
jgi:flagellar basal-body rod protein FlgG